MDRGKMKKLNGYHVLFLIISAMSGFSQLTLPNDLSPMGFNQWIILLSYGVVAPLTLIPMVSLCKKYPDDNLFSINQKLLGRIPGKLINALIIFYGILIVTGGSMSYLTAMQMSILNNRDFTLPLILLLLACAYIVSGGIKLVARFCIIASFVALGALFALRWPLMKGTFTQLYPVLNFTSKDVAVSFHQGFKAIRGYELILFYFPYIIHQNKAFKQAVLGIWLVILQYLGIVITCIVYFSLWQLSSLHYPTLTVLQAIEFSFIQRVENILMSLWVFPILSTLAAYMWMTKKGMDNLRGKIRAWHLWVSIAISLAIILAPLPRPQEDFLLETLPLYMCYGIILWPGFLLIIHKIKSLGGKTA